MTQVESGSSTNTLYAHAERTTIGGSSYYLHKLSSANGPAIILNASAASTGRKLMGRWVYSLNGIVSIPASTWTVTYRVTRGSTASAIVVHADVDVLIRKSDGTIRATIATNVANSPNILGINVWETLTGTYSWPGYTVVDQTDYLEVAYYIQVTTSQNGKYARLLVDDGTLPLADQTKIENMIFTYPNQAPVASFTYSPADPYAQEIITFDASASYDPDGSIVSYKWDFGDGNIETVTTSIITHAYVDCGNYTVTLTVTDNEGLASSTSQTITVVNPSLLRLWADVGSYVGSHSDAWILESWVAGSNVPPGGSVSFDLYIDAISNPDMRDPAYDVYLAVAVNDTAQVASITIGPTTITTFTYGEVTWPAAAGGGTLSRHGVYPTWYALAPFGNVTSNHGYYTIPGDPYGPYWAFRAHVSVTITASATMNASFKVHFDAQGTLVRGSTDPRDRNSNSFSHDLTFGGALSVLIPPVACFTVSNDSPNVCETVTFNASCSYDLDGVIVKYEWDWEGDGIYDFDAGNNSITYHHYDTYGYYYPKLRVTDNDGLTDEAGTTIHVRQHPVARFDYYPSSPLVCETVTFNASASTPDGGTIISYKWNFGDGNITIIGDNEPITPIITHHYTALGDYNVTLTVTDSEDKSDTTWKVITVAALNYYLTVQTDPAGIVTIPGEGWYGNCTYVDLTAPEFVPNATGVNGERYRFDNWTVNGDVFTTLNVTVHMDANHTVTAHYVKQYRLTMSTNFGTTNPSVGQHWYDAGSVVPIQAFAPSLVYPPSQERYVWNGWTGTGNGSYSTLNNPASVTMNGPITQTASWTHQFLLTIKTSGLPSAYPTKVYLGGLQVGTASDASPYTKWFNSGASTGTIGVDSTVSGATGTRYAFVKWVEDSSTNNPRASVNMNSPKTFTAKYKTQYYLTLATNPSGVDAPTGSGWYDNGTYASISTAMYDDIVSGESRYRFNGWTTTDMTEISDPASPSTTVRMDKAKTVTANYVTQYLVTFAQTGLDATATGTVVTVDGVGKSFGNLPFNKWVDSGSSVTYSYSNMVSSTTTGKRFSLVSVTGPTSPFTVTGRVTVTGNYKTQYQLTVNTDPSGIVTIPGGGWYDDSTDVTLTAPTVVNYNFINWDVDGVSRGPGVNPITVHMDRSHTATAHYQRTVVVPVGGHIVPIDKSCLLVQTIGLVPWIGVAFAFLTAMAVVIILIRRGNKLL